MAITAYCKKCGREVEPGEVCPYCGGKLGRSMSHTVWCAERTPVRNWMCWNAVMRLLLPAGLAVLLLMLLLELLTGGAGALERLFASGFALVLLILLGAVIAVVFVLLLLQGKDITDCTVDSKGVHVICYLPDPTPVRLLARLKSPAMMKQAEVSGGICVLKLETREILWKDVTRVQLWPEKCLVLFYAPSWWLRVSLPCTPFVWEDVMQMIRDRIGRKKQVKLPQELVVRSEKTKRRSAGPARTENVTEQISMTDLFSEEANDPQNKTEQE